LSTWQARKRHRLLARNSRAEELGCRPSREEGRRGRRRISVLHGHLHELEKVQMRQLPRKPKHSPASRSARGACPIRADYARWCSAFLRMTPGGLTKLSSAGGPPRFRRLRESTRSHETARGRPLWRAERLAGTMRLQPLRKECVTLCLAATAPSPRVEHAARRAP
jgi:hypothetical protein